MSIKGDQCSNLNLYNEKKKPLEEIILERKEKTGLKSIPALSSQFAQPRSMSTYCAPPQKVHNGDFLLGAKEEWLSRMEYFASDCQWLLELSHYRFWSQITFQQSSWKVITSFLQEAYPFYALHLLPDDGEIILKYHRINELVFCILSRVTTQRESKFEWIGDKKYSELLYDNFIISLPMLLDICVIFGNTNKEEVKRMINTAFKCAPSYNEDLKKCIMEVKVIFKSIEDRLSINLPAGEVVKLKEMKLGRNEISDSSVSDILFYALDVCATLSSFVEYYPKAASVMHSLVLETRLVSFYESVVTNVSKNIQKICNDDGKVDTYFELTFKLNQVRFFIIELFRQCLTTPLDFILENSGKLTEDETKNNADSYLGILTECLSDQIFIRDYNKKYPVEHDLDLLSQVCPDLDGVKYDYIIQSVLTCYDLPPMKAPSNSIQIKIPVKKDTPKKNIPVKVKEKMKGVELESLVTQVKDLLPHLGDGFVEECLHHYDYDSTAVINAVLENSLPENLLNIPMDLPVIPPEITEDAASALPPRLNVFDNDEFDVMSRDYIDKSRIHIGKKKDKYKDIKELLDDKSHIDEMRQLYSTLGNVEENGYDDEYDDTYDSVDVSVGEAGEPERRQFVVPRVLQPRPQIKEEEEVEGDSDEEENMAKGSTSFQPFVENPEVVRARYEERRMSKYPNRNNRHDVKGNAKGQGQEKEVLINRQKKNVNKSSQSNHNRRRNAQFKRQGMLPLS